MRPSKTRREATEPNCGAGVRRRENVVCEMELGAQTTALVNGLECGWEIRL